MIQIKVLIKPYSLIIRFTLEPGRADIHQARLGIESAEAPEHVALRARYTASRELDNVLITSHSHRNIELGFYVVVIQCDG